MRRLALSWLIICAVIFCAWQASAQLVGEGVFKHPGAAAPSTTTFDPSNKGTIFTLSGGNLIATQNLISNTGQAALARSITSHSSGKYYNEFTPSGGVWSQIYTASFGITNATSSLNVKLGADTNSGVLYQGDGSTYTFFINNASVGPVQPQWFSGNVLGMASDFTNLLWWYRIGAGNWNNSGTANPATGAGGLSLSTLAAGPYYAAVAVIDTGSPGLVWTANFGGSAYANTAPAGFGNW